MCNRKGHTNTRRIHLHGLFYAREGQTKWQLTKLLYENWIDGYKYYGRYVNEKTINYVSKYMTKKDEDNPDYISIVLSSKGLGSNYVKKNQLKHKWDGEETIITYKAHNGQDLPLPRYYSKGARGLSVFPRVGGIFTSTIISLGPWLRQPPSIVTGKQIGRAHV